MWAPPRRAREPRADTGAARLAGLQLHLLHGAPPPCLTHSGRRPRAYLEQNVADRPRASASSVDSRQLHLILVGPHPLLLHGAPPPCLTHSGRGPRAYLEQNVADRPRASASRVDSRQLRLILVGPHPHSLERLRCASASSVDSRPRREGSRMVSSRTHPVGTSRPPPRPRCGPAP